MSQMKLNREGKKVRRMDRKVHVWKACVEEERHGSKVRHTVKGKNYREKV